MKKKIGMFVLAMVMAAALPSFSVTAAAGEINISVDGLLQSLETKPIIVDGYTMVGLSEMSELFGAQVSWEPEKKAAMINLPGKRIEVKVGEKIAKVNFDNREMPVAPVIVKDRIMVPLSYVSQVFGYKVSWNGVTRLVAIDTPKKDFSVLEAIERERQSDKVMEFTYQQALERIHGNNSSLKTLAESRVIVERNKDEVNKAVENKNLRLEFGFENVYTQEDVDLFRSRKSLENQLLAMRANEKLAKEGDEIKLRNALTTIDKADYDIYLLRQQIQRDEKDLEIIKLKLSLGMETESNLKAKENSLEKSRINLKNLETSQQDNLLALNNTLSVAADVLVVIKDYKPMTGPVSSDVEGYVQEQLKNSPTVTLKEIDLDNAKFKLYSYETLLRKDLQEPDYKEDKPATIVVNMENDILSAQRGLDETKTSLDKTIRNTYNNITQLNDSYASGVLDLDNAINAYRDAVNSYLSGNATMNDIEKLRMNILNAEISLEKVNINYDIAKFGYSYPYLR